MAAKVKDKMLEQANDTIDALAERAKDALQRAANGAEQARGNIDSVWRVADKARGQAGDLAEDIYARGRDTALAIGQRVEEQPFTALAVAGIFGAMLGYMLRGR